MPRHPFGWIVPERRALLFGFAAIVTLAVMIGLMRGGQTLHTPHAPLGVISFELSGSTEAAKQMVAEWNTQQRIAAGFNLGLDFLFLFAYPFAIGLGCVLVADRFAGRDRGFARLGCAIAWLQLISGALDGIENYALLRVLFEPAAPNWAFLATCAAVPKFALVAVGLVYLFAGAAWLSLTRPPAAAT